MHSGEKVRDTTLDDEKYDSTHIIKRHIICVVVTALCNQPGAFSSDLGDDQSRYSFTNYFIRVVDKQCMVHINCVSWIHILHCAATLCFARVVLA